MVNFHEFFTDNGGEYLNTDVDLFCDEVCNIRRLSTPYCPPQNAIAERLLGILLGPMRAYFAASDVPQDFWPYAADLFVNYITCYRAVRWKMRFHLTSRFSTVSLTFHGSVSGDVNAIFI